MLNNSAQVLYFVCIALYCKLHLTHRLNTGNNNNNRLWEPERKQTKHRYVKQSLKLNTLFMQILAKTHTKMRFIHPNSISRKSERINIWGSITWCGLAATWRLITQSCWTGGEGTLIIPTTEVEQGLLVVSSRVLLHKDHTDYEETQRDLHQIRDQTEKSEKHIEDNGTWATVCRRGCNINKYTEKEVMV